MRDWVHGKLRKGLLRRHIELKLTLRDVKSAKKLTKFVAYGDGYVRIPV